MTAAVSPPAAAIDACWASHWTAMRWGSSGWTFTGISIPTVIAAFMRVVGKMYATSYGAPLGGGTSSSICIAKRSPGTGSAKPLATALAGIPFSMTSRSPRSSTAAPMSLKDCRIDGMPPWWSLTPLRSRIPLKKPIRAPFRPGAPGLPAVYEGGGGGVGVVLDGDRLALRDALHLGGKHRLLDRRLVRVARGGLDRYVDLPLLATADLGVAGLPDSVNDARGLDTGCVELLRHLGVRGL